MLTIAPQSTYTGVYGDFTLKDLAGFPFTVYFENQQRYLDFEAWYTGTSLVTTKKSKDDESDNFPVRVNPIKTAVQKHVSAVFGEYNDGGDNPPVRFRVKNQDGTTDDHTERIETALQTLFSENNAGPAMIENGLISQIYGGCVFKISYDPEASLQTKLRLDSIHPKYFIGVPYGSNYWRLREAWVVQQISAEEALKYGIEIPNTFAYYIEHWTPTNYEIQINNVLIEYDPMDPLQGERGKNPFGFVPFVYIPHVRAIGYFYGESIITDAVKGLTRELNKNIADAGDAVTDDIHSYAVASNTRGIPAIVELADGLKVIMLGSGGPGLGGADNRPAMDYLRKNNISQPMVDLVGRVEDLLERELYTPSVAYGDFGGGTQRSSSSLYTVMWALTAHAKVERIWWTAGLQALARMGLLMMAENGTLGIQKEDAQLRISIQWAEHLPRDREELVNELAVRASNNLGSMEHLLEKTGDIDDVSGQMKTIKDWLEFQAELKAKSVPQQPFNQPGAAPKPKPTPTNAVPKNK